MEKIFVENYWYILFYVLDVSESWNMKNLIPYQIRLIEEVSIKSQ